MTHRNLARKMSITIPEELARILDELPNRSEYITEALRERHQRDTLANLFTRHGVPVTADGVARMAARIYPGTETAAAA
jgi:hypothetical protein